MNFSINGFGRIGRALFRISFYGEENNCVHINEPNASIDDIIYFLKYDSLYSNIKASIKKVSNSVFSVESIDRKWEVSVSHGINPHSINTEASLIVDASGMLSNLESYKEMEKKVIVTTSSPLIPYEIILGFNDEKLLLKDRPKIISGSICDNIAIAPILGKLNNNHQISETFITTLHPALSYQRVIDNYSPIGINRSLGRQYIDSIIPKRTSLESVLKYHFGEDFFIRCLSFRIPTESVCSADITIIFREDISCSSVLDELKQIPSNILGFSEDDVVSIDFKASTVSATIDMRWFEIIDGHILKMIIWYDNEWGYSSRINNIISAIE